MPLQRSFYSRDTVIVARELLGKLLCFNSPEGRVSGVIVETEAYLAFNDPASHNYKGKNLRNVALFGAAGHAYIHRIHTYYCFDVVTEGIEQPGSVLIRAVEPVEGIPLMKRNRKTDNLLQLTNGPGKLCQAFGITLDQYGVDVTQGILTLEPHISPNHSIIIRTTRIGITRAADKLLRFYIKDNRYVSRR